MTQVETLQHAPSGAADGPDERSGWGGYMPNDEDGLMTLADFGRDHGWENPNPGNQPDGGQPGGPDGVGSDGPHGGGPISPGGGFTGGGPGGGPGGKPGDNGNNGGVGGNGGDGGTPGTGDPSGPGSPWTGGGDDGGKPCYWYCDGPPGGDPPGFVPDPGPQGPGGDPPITSPAPEPATWMMLILGLGALGSVLRAQRRRAGQVTALGAQRLRGSRQVRDRIHLRLTRMVALPLDTRRFIGRGMRA